MTDINKIIKIKTNDIRPSKGKILISEPLLSDNYFKRSVVLLAEHNEEGSFGIILNKPMDNKFNEILKDFPDFGGPLYLGGPVSNSSLFFIHTLGDVIENSQEIMDGLYWGGDIESVKELILDMFDTEDAHMPYRDVEIVGLLKKKGLSLARRTVAKYRADMGICSSKERRRANAAVA